jgi:CHASE2 domain-containing sensor protein
MTHQWFSPEDAIWFASAGVLSLTALAAPVIARGRHKRLIVGTWGVTIVAGMLLLVAGVIAVLEGQPGHVVVPLMATGVIMAVGYGISLLFVLRAYRIAEHRKVAAREL